jgi:hypothetical protein
MATTIQKLLFVDTNIWLDFYRAQNEAYLGLLEKVEALKPKILVTHQLETEYKKNRQAVIIASIELLQAHRLKKVPSVGVLAQAKQFKMLGQDIDKANGRIKKLQDRLIAMLAEPSKKDTLEKVAAVVYERHFHSPERRSTDWLDRCLGQARAGLDELTRRLAKPYACGVAFTHADVMITTLIWYMQDRMNEVLSPSAHAALISLAEHCEALPAFRAAALSDFEKMPRS